MERHQMLQGSDQAGTPQRLMCEADGAECEIAAGAILPGNVGVKAAKSFLPCHRCRLAPANAARLPGTRLGQRERHVLLLAASVDAPEGVLVCNASDSRAIKEAKMRAARKLAKAGLVSSSRPRVRITRIDRRIHKRAWWDHERKALVGYRKDLREEVDVPVVAVKLTPLGAEIKRRYQAELMSGRAIRWDSRATEAGLAAQGETTELAAEFRKEIHEYACWKAGMDSLMAHTEKDAS